MHSTASAVGRIWKLIYKILKRVCFEHIIVVPLRNRSKYEIYGELIHCSGDWNVKCDLKILNRQFQIKIEPFVCATHLFSHVNRFICIIIVSFHFICKFDGFVFPLFFFKEKNKIRERETKKNRIQKISILMTSLFGGIFLHFDYSTKNE